MLGEKHSRYSSATNRRAGIPKAVWLADELGELSLSEVFVESVDQLLSPEQGLIELLVSGEQLLAQYRDNKGVLHASALSCLLLE
ncbi:Uncharacterised protein [Mycobacteroides abscessus subsp. abscessus]|nr:Uncharacterised protein [Mycobacteroides abscessus subsp. abscessus]